MQKLSPPETRRRARGRQGTEAVRQELAELDDAALLRMVRLLPPGSPRRASACELLVGRYRNLVVSCVRRYRNVPEPVDDLMQVAYVGLLNAINNFDPAFGGSLAAYAQPCITGEIKRHFRDKRWQVHVRRQTQELALQVRDATSELAQKLGHAPTDADLASTLGTTEAMVRQARLASMAFQTVSLDAPLAGERGLAGLAEALGSDDPNIELALDLQAVATHWPELPRREQRILAMRFFGDMTQAQIGAQLGISQVQVSRLIAHALGYLRDRVLGIRESSAYQEAS